MSDNQMTGGVDRSVMNKARDNQFIARAIRDPDRINDDNSLKALGSAVLSRKGEDVSSASPAALIAAGAAAKEDIIRLKAEGKGIVEIVQDITAKTTPAPAAKEETPAPKTENTDQPQATQEDGVSYGPMPNGIDAIVNAQPAQNANADGVSYGPMPDGIDAIVKAQSAQNTNADGMSYGPIPDGIKDLMPEPVIPTADTPSDSGIVMLAADTPDTQPDAQAPTTEPLQIFNSSPADLYAQFMAVTGIAIEEKPTFSIVAPLPQSEDNIILRNQTTDTSYKIESGDTLSQIVQNMYDTDPDNPMTVNDIRQRYEQVAALNGIENPNKIMAGQSITLPEPEQLNAMLENRLAVPEQSVAMAFDQRALTADTMKLG